MQFKIIKHGVTKTMYSCTGAVCECSSDIKWLHLSWVRHRMSCKVSLILTVFIFAHLSWRWRVFKIIFSLSFACHHASLIWYQKISTSCLGLQRWMIYIYTVENSNRNINTTYLSESIVWRFNIFCTIWLEFLIILDYWLLYFIH